MSKEHTNSLNIFENQKIICIAHPSAYNIKHELKLNFNDKSFRFEDSMGQHTCERLTGNFEYDENKLYLFYKFRRTPSDYHPYEEAKISIDQSKEIAYSLYKQSISHPQDYSNNLVTRYIITLGENPTLFDSPAGSNVGRVWLLAKDKSHEMRFPKLFFI